MDAKTAYECFVGSITPFEFVDKFDCLGDAIEQLIAEEWWTGTGQVAPDNLAELIREYAADWFIANYESILNSGKVSLFQPANYKFNP